MVFKQFYLGCLAHASYLIGSGRDAVVVDPQRDVQQYIDEAKANGLTIRYVIETHLHADFVSGHRELAAKTGADIVFGSRAGAEFTHRAVQNGDELRIGKVILRGCEDIRCEWSRLFESSIRRRFGCMILDSSMVKGDLKDFELAINRGRKGSVTPDRRSSKLFACCL